MIILIITSVIFILLGLICPQIKTINGFIGYKTYRAMKNQRNWEFAQKYSGKLMLYFGATSAIYTVLAYLFPFINIGESLYFIVLTLYIAFLIYKTETALKKIEQEVRKHNTTNN
ncbi:MULTISPECIES: SdpI family protein [Myroides]|uniref:SdpI family protein n=1 Tax=Myroides TaxID=76831 RepID=UPI0013034AE3|nr:SdpI family protein [Myroides phaeus]